MADDVLTRIEERVKKNKVMLYMKGTPDFPQCGFSAHTVEILKSYGVPFATEDVLADPAVREGIKRYSDHPAGLYRWEIRRWLRHSARAA
jgi:monothiol glutaredoxin